MADYRFNMTGAEMERRLDLANTALQPGWMPTAAEVGALVKSDLLNMVYPVGSIYMSANNVSPASFLGGTWEQIQDRFLLAAGDSYSAGSTGGEAAHTLTVNEMPQHTHGPLIGSDIINYVSSGGNVGTAPGDNLQGANSVYPAGGGQPHNNMPPYLAVYMWKRTA